MRASLLECVVAVLFAAAAASRAVGAPIEAGDRAWAARAESIEVRLATPERVEEAIDHYRAAVVVDPLSLEARWKLLRALHYAIDFTTLGEAAKDARVEEAVALASASGEALDAEGATVRDRARLFFWSAIAWGARAQRVGLLTVVREGAATQMHDYAERSLALDPTVDRGGALRLLARLHATLPRVPFVSGWVDRARALPFAERANREDAAHPGNRLVLALTLIDVAPERKKEARELLESVVEVAPRDDHRVEDLAIREQAREELEKLRDADG